MHIVKKIAAAASVITVLAVGMAACDTENNADAGTRTAGYTAAPVTTVAKPAPTTTAKPAPSLEDVIRNSPGTKAAAPVKKVADPLTTDGTWLVPGDIKPGTYRVIPTSTYGISGYWALCATLVCNPGAGMLDNDIVSGPGFLVIGADAVAVEHKRVKLEAIA